MCVEYNVFILSLIYVGCLCVSGLMINHIHLNDLNMQGTNVCAQ